MKRVVSFLIIMLLKSCAFGVTYYLSGAENSLPAMLILIAGAIFFNAGEMYGVDFEGKNETEDHIKNCAKELLASGRELSSKNKALLKLISVSPKLFGVIYNKTKKA